MIDFEGFLDGKPFDGGKAEGHSLELGSGSFVPGFEEQLVGAKAGDEKELNITFPEDYHAELAGKAVVFKVKVHEVKAKELPEVDDEFAKDVSEFDTLADFKKDLGEKLKERRETQNQRDFEAALMEQVMDNMEVEIPDAMVEYEADNLVNDMAQRIQAQGIPFDQYLAMTGMTMDIMREQAKPLLWSACAVSWRWRHRGCRKYHHLRRGAGGGVQTSGRAVSHGCGQGEGRSDRRQYPQGAELPQG